ncbi:MAG: GTP 3',8-cyclase MoaA [Actinomycetes bacterium]
MMRHVRGDDLVDAFGRVVRDLRISVTDRCDLRCSYCMPPEGLEWIPSEEVLTFEEIARLAALFKGVGVSSVRLTGGEPLVRARLADLVSDLRLIGFEDLSMTTNGTGLARNARKLKDAGLHRVNVSIDSLLSHRYEEITRRSMLAQVLQGIEVAMTVGLAPVKINCVVMPGTNDDEILDFVEFARLSGCQVRFIENMPLGAQGGWSPEQMFPAVSILALVEDRYDLVELPRSSAPARLFAFADGSPGGIGVIASVTAPFCETCDRLRLTADGAMRTCLFAHGELDLRGPMRAGASDDELLALIRAEVHAKGRGHEIGAAGFRQPVRVMSRIGG